MKRHWWVFTLTLSLAFTYSGLQLAPCQSGVVGVLENSDSFSFTCDQYSDAVTWYYKTRTSLEQTIGTCNASSCQPNTGIPSGLFRLIFVNASSSRLSLANQVTVRRYGITYRCADSQANPQCQVNVVSHAVVPPSGLTFATTRWNLQGSSNITSVYSSLGRYSCSWTERRETGQLTAIPGVKLTLTPNISDTSNTQNRTGTCTFSKGLPTDDGNYTYNVEISPGNTEQTGGSVQIARPLTPNTTCSPGPYVPVNTRLSCTCSTENVGQPEGRLRWVRGRYSLINHGDYGDTVLDMTPQALSEADHNSTTFRCDIEWVENIQGTTYTALVGLPPSRLALTANPSTVSEGQQVIFDCSADGRPTPFMTLYNQILDKEVTRQYSPLSHIMSRAQCEDAGHYTCTASNGVGSDQAEDVTLLVLCKPRGENGQSGPMELPAVNFVGDPVSLNFNTTAYPSPHLHSFTFLGRDNTANGSNVDLTNITMNVSCQQRSRPINIATCSITIDNATSAAAGFYRLTLTNSQGDGHFVFQLKVNDDELLTTITPGVSSDGTGAASPTVTKPTTGPVSGKAAESSTTVLAIGLGAGLALTLLIVVIVCVWLWRREWKLPCADKTVPVPVVPYELPGVEGEMDHVYSEANEDNRRDTTSLPETSKAAGQMAEPTPHRILARANPYTDSMYQTPTPGNQTAGTASDRRHEKQAMNDPLTDDLYLEPKPATQTASCESTDAVEGDMDHVYSEANEDNRPDTTFLTETPKRAGKKPKRQHGKPTKHQQRSGEIHLEPVQDQHSSGHEYENTAYEAPLYQNTMEK